MPWLTALAFRAATIPSGAIAYIPGPRLAEGGSNTDIITAAVQQVLGYGVLGCVAIALAWIVYKGSFVPQRRTDELIAAARADLLRENEQLRAEKDRAEAALTESLRFARDELAPLLVAFNSSVAALLPILQELVRHDDRPPPRRRREIT